MKPLVVTGDLDALPLLADFVAEAARTAGLESCVAYRLRLAVNEIAANIIEHGFRARDTRGEISISAILQADRLVILLEDDSQPFDPVAAPEPDVTLPPEQRPDRGLGIFLARKSVDQVKYERHAVRNRTVFVVDRDADCADVSP